MDYSMATGAQIKDNFLHSVTRVSRCGVCPPVLLGVVPDNAVTASLATLALPSVVTCVLHATRSEHTSFVHACTIHRCRRAHTRTRAVCVDATTMGDDAQDSGSNSLDGGEATDVTSVEVRVFITVLYAGFLWGMHWFAGRVDQGRILQQEAKLPPADLERMDVERDEIEALKKKRGRVGKTVVKCIMFDGEILPLWKYIVWRNPYFSLYFDGHQFNTRKRTDKLGKGVMMPCKNADKWPDPLSQGCTCWRLYWSLMWPKFKRDKRDVPQSIRRAVFGASMMFSIVLSMAFSKLVGVPKTPGATCNDANDISQLANCKFDTEFSWELSLIVALMSMPLATVLNRLGDAMSRS